MAGTELAKAYVQIIPSAEGIKGKLTSALSGEASAAGNSAGKTAGASLGSSIKAAIVAAGIGTAIKSALSEGADLQQSLGGIETLFKDSADKVIANAHDAYKTTGLSANDYMESVTSFSASLLQGLAGDTEKAADIADMALTDMSDNANKMGTSMEMIQNAYQGFAKQNYTMLDNLKLGYGGTKTEMERLLADATELSGVEYDINNLSDVYEAIHVIQNEMGITGTTAKEAASTFSGSFASMKASLSNLLGSLALGEDIQPAMDALLDSTGTFLINNLVPMVGNIFASLVDYIIDTVLNTDWNAVISQALTSVRDALQSGITTYLGADTWQVMSESATTAFQTLWEVCNTVWTTIGQPIWDMVSSAVSSLYTLFADNMPAIQAFVSEAFAGMQDTWQNHLKPMFEAIGAFLNDYVKPAFEYVWKNFILPLIENVFSLIGKLWTGTLKPIFDAICDFITGVFTGDWQLMGDSILSILEGLWNGIVAIFDTLLHYLAEVWVNIEGDVKKYWENIKLNITNKITEAKNNAVNIFTQIYDGIKSKIELARDVVKNAIDKIKGFFDFEWSLPDLKMPHFTIQGSFSLNPPSTPSFGIEWYAKAMNEPMIMNSPTAFGINSLGQIMAGGEAGSEVVSGTDTLMRMIATAVASQNGTLEDTMNNGFTNLLTLLVQYLPQLANMKIVMNSGAVVGELAPGMDAALGKLAVRNGRGA